MNLTHTHLGDDVTCSTQMQLLKIDGIDSTFSVLACICEVEGYDREIRLSYPHKYFSGHYTIMFQLVFLSKSAGENGVRAALSCRLVDPSRAIEPSPGKTSGAETFRHPSDSSALVELMSAPEARLSGYLRSQSLSVECTITVFRDGIPVLPSSPSLAQQFGQLLDSKVGADVTFVVSGESFVAHKNVLAARSPVFMAEFFGGMVEKTSGRVEIKEMEPSVFGAMLRFLYTDAVPELTKTIEAAATVVFAQRLLVAADRYGLDMLKVMCERSLASAIDTSTAAATLALAERHGCSQLKAKCVEFIAGGSRANHEAVMETDGFKDLAVNSPPILAELLLAAHGRKD